jgi:hypothetical protein
VAAGVAHVAQDRAEQVGAVLFTVPTMVFLAVSGIVAGSGYWAGASFGLCVLCFVDIPVSRK